MKKPALSCAGFRELSGLPDLKFEISTYESELFGRIFPGRFQVVALADSWHKVYYDRMSPVVSAAGGARFSGVFPESDLDSFTIIIEESVRMLFQN